jgi:hypothetical protein
VIRVGAVLNFHSLQPRVFSRRLVKVPVNTDISHIFQLTM